jgi:hypothetical protein
VAKAQFHRHQRVWVDAVGAWAIIDRIIPVWAKGFDEPVRITYDVGLGREFLAQELQAEAPSEMVAPEESGGSWRILRARNKWQEPQDCAHHPFPGTFPVVVTDSNDWGGWRVPAAEYDRDPHKVEFQARLIACAPKLMTLMRELATVAGESTGEVPPELMRLGKVANTMVRYITEQPAAPEPHAQAAE